MSVNNIKKCSPEIGRYLRKHMLVLIYSILFYSILSILFYSILIFYSYILAIYMYIYCKKYTI